MSAIPKNRLEAFSDGVLAIIITIMVLELKAPVGTSLYDLKPVLPEFLSYVLSFVYLAIYWNNHHHLIHTAKHVNAQIMWANMHLLFWLSLIPFATSWIDDNNGGSWPTALYGIVLFMCAIAYTLLQTCIVNMHGKNSALAHSLGKDWKGKISLLGYVIAIIFSFWMQHVSHVIFVLIALMWITPDRRLERSLLSD